MLKEDRTTFKEDGTMLKEDGTAVNYKNYKNYKNNRTYPYHVYGSLLMR